MCTNLFFVKRFSFDEFFFSENWALFRSVYKFICRQKLTPFFLKKCEPIYVWPKNEWTKKHLQIIFFGREHCPARNHDLKECPICSWAASKKRILEEAKSKK